METSFAQARSDYEKALAMGLKQGGSLAVLDRVLLQDEIQSKSEYPLGVMQIPMEQIVGTYTQSRSLSFSKQFYPVMKMDSEFATKWISLMKYHMEEGINDPIKVYEYLNKYYVIEGNKRVSVLRYLQADSIAADVIRIIPPIGHREDFRINHEYIAFYQITRVNYIYFRHPGCFMRLLRVMGRSHTELWTDDDRKSFESLYISFRGAFEKVFGPRDYVAVSEAFLRYLTIFGYENAKDVGQPRIVEQLEKAKATIQASEEEQTSALLMDPNASAQKKSFWQQIFAIKGKEILKVGFVYNKNPEISGWTHAHDIGRRSIDDIFAGKVETKCYENVPVENAYSTLEKAIADGCKLIFTTSPVFLKESVKASLEHQNIHILNCSLNKAQKSVRTYYARMYEVRFLLGALAASLSQSDRIGFVADYPVFGTVAGVNAFAIGAQMINPNAQVYLNWASIDGVDMDGFFWDNGLSIICDKDHRIGDTKRFGLYHIEEGEIWNIAQPVWNWSVFYEQMVRAQLNGQWKSDDNKHTAGSAYWWGMSSGIVDLIASGQLPSGTRRLVRTLRDSIIRGSLLPFRGPIVTQEGATIKGGFETLDASEIITMDWLAENIIGEIPSKSSLTKEAQMLTDIQGINAEENLI